MNSISERATSATASEKDEQIGATFRNGSLTAISVIVGFSLSFLAKWAGIPGSWNGSDLLAVAAIAIGIVLQIITVALLLSVTSLSLSRYNRAVTIFLIGLVFVCIGVTAAIIGDIAGFEQRILRG